jgi:hypothetical protein
MLPLGKLLVLIGIAVTLIGGLMLAGWQIPFLGKLPGDITIKRDDLTLYFPLTTSLVISLILSLLATWWRR